MPKPIDKLSRSKLEHFRGKHRFEHWLVDQQVYFITAGVRDQYRAFASEEAKSVFWDRFAHWSTTCGFQPWVTSLLDNHSHTLGFLPEGKQLPIFMQRLHGSVAKLVNDLLSERYPMFWRDTKGREYFDGCLRRERQCRLTWRYVLTQSVRHGVCEDWCDDAHTQVTTDLQAAGAFAHEGGGFLEGVPYPRYERRP